MKYKEVRTISFNWWNADDANDESTNIPLKHCPRLKENALSRINKMLLKDIYEGELLDKIDDINYRGQWKIVITGSRRKQ